MRLVQLKNGNHNIIAGIGCHEELVYEDQFECRKSCCLNNRVEGFTFEITFLVLDEKGIPVMNEYKYKDLEMTVLSSNEFSFTEDVLDSLEGILLNEHLSFEDKLEKIKNIGVEAYS